MAPALGIDVGNRKCVVANSVSGVVDGVPNEEGYHETPSTVHFTGNNRLFGAACPSYDLKSTISQPKRLFLGDSSLLPYETVEKTVDGFLGVRVFHRQEQQEFTATQVLAMLLGHLKRTTATSANFQVSSGVECVLAIPSYFDQRQIEAYKDAAVIAGLYPLDVLRDGHAVAIEFQHHSVLAEGIAAGNVVFVDVGHSDTQVTVASFDAKAMYVIGEAFDKCLVGRDFDEAILDYFVNKCREHHQMDVSSNEKAKSRLRTACEKAKKVLSVSREARVNVDFLIGDRDLDEVITRETFEGLASDLLDRIVRTCDHALQNARLEKQDVSHVELVGSGTRIPAISRRLAAFFGRELSRILHGSECVARGCALECERLMGRKQNQDGRSERNLGEYSRKEDELLMQDKEIKKARRARYDVESIVYSISNEVSKEEKIDEEIQRTLDQFKDWFDEKGDEACEEDYKKKKEELRSVLDNHSNRAYLRILENYETSSSINDVWYRCQCNDVNDEKKALLPGGVGSNKGQKRSLMCMLSGWTTDLLWFIWSVVKRTSSWIQRLLGRNQSCGSSPNDPDIGVSSRKRICSRSGIRK